MPNTGGADMNTYDQIASIEPVERMRPSTRNYYAGTGLGVGPLPYYQPIEPAPRMTTEEAWNKAVALLMDVFQTSDRFSSSDILGVALYLRG